MARVDTFKLKGQVLDARYRVDEVVGEGSFGLIYRATQVNFDEPVAIKVLKVPGQLNAEDTETFLQTFRAEGKLLRKLSADHPAFVRAHDTGVIDMDGVPAPYLVLEWLEGLPLDEDLAQRRTNGDKPRSMQESLALLEPIFGALTRAHAEQVAHRDIKPANVFLVQSALGPKAKLLDFGMAKVMTVAGTQGLHVPTQGGLAGLTPAYAAPEQWDRQLGATGPWTDVYALALVFVELLTDKPPLDGDDIPSYMAATFDEETRPTPNTRGASISADVEAVFAKALAVYPKDRYRHAGEFWNALLDAHAVANASAGQTLAKIAAPTNDLLEPDEVSRDVRSSSKTLVSQSKPVAKASLAFADTILAEAAKPVDVGEQKSEPVAHVEAAKSISAPEERKRVLLVRGAFALAALLLLVLVGGMWRSKGAGDATAGKEANPASSAQVLPDTHSKKKRMKWWEDLPDAPDQAAAAKLTPSQQKWLAMHDQALQHQAAAAATPKKRDEAVAALRSAQKIACEELGEDDPACAETKRILGVMLAQMGRLAEAEQLLRDALALNDKYGDKDDEDFDDSRKALVAVLVKRGKPQEAQEFLKGDESLPAPAKASTPNANSPTAAETHAGKPGSTPAGAAPKDDKDETWMKVLDKVLVGKKRVKK